MWNSPNNQLGILAVNQLCHIFHLPKMACFQQWDYLIFGGLGAQIGIKQNEGCIEILQIVKSLVAQWDWQPYFDLCCLKFCTAMMMPLGGLSCLANLIIFLQRGGGREKKFPPSPSVAMNGERNRIKNQHCHDFFPGSLSWGIPSGFGVCCRLNKKRGSK